MSVVSFGELLIDFVALESGVSVGDASGFQKAPGGAPANVAVAVARLGQRSAFLGQVGDDPFGHYLAEVLQTEGVDVSRLRFSTEARTALAFVSLRSDGERSFVFYRHPSADMLMRPEDVALDVLGNHQIFHFGSITLINEPSRSATLEAVKAAHKQGLLISYDPNLRLALWPDTDTARREMLTGMQYAHIVKVSDEEIEFLTGGSDPTRLWQDGNRLIVVTHGERGATALTADGQMIDAPGFPVQAVDTTGAGDSFVAGLLVGILQRGATKTELNDAAELRDILRFANATGALTTKGRGAIPSLPTREQVEVFLATVS